MIWIATMTMKKIYVMMKMMISIILSLITLGSTVYWNYQSVVEPVEVDNVPLLTGTASWYDYDLDIEWGKGWSKKYNYCALRIYERYHHYKVCSVSTWKCVVCKQNDRWPSREDRVIDLTSHAFKELWVPLSRWLTEVYIYKLD